MSKSYLERLCTCTGFFLRFRFGDRKEIIGDRLEEFERPFSIVVISGHYISRDRWRNLRDRFGSSKHLKKNTAHHLLGLLVRSHYLLTIRYFVPESWAWTIEHKIITVIWNYNGKNISCA